MNGGLVFQLGGPFKHKHGFFSGFGRRLGRCALGPCEASNPWREIIKQPELRPSPRDDPESILSAEQLEGARDPGQRSEAVGTSTLGSRCRVWFPIGAGSRACTRVLHAFPAPSIAYALEEERDVAG